MADIPIWPGSSSFTTGSTPFGFYDTDAQFQTDADKVAKHCAYKMGYPIVEIELQDINFYACFEEAVTTYGNELYQYKIRENYLTYEGTTTGSNYNNSVVTPNLGNIIRMSKTYGAEAGSGGNVTWYSGSISITAGQQGYDLTEWANASASLSAGDSIEIKRIFYHAPPAITRFFDPYAGTGTGIQSLMDTFGFGSFSPGINFMLMPIYFDVAKIQAIELNDQVRKSGYSFELVNNQLKLFPIPTRNGQLYFDYIKVSERNSPIDSNVSGSDNLVTNPGNVPYANPVYSQINSVGKAWIYSYTLALAKENLGYVRGKYDVIPIPGDEVNLNDGDLISAGQQDQENLLEQLRGMLDDTSRQAQLERRKEEAQSAKDMLGNVPMTIYIG